MTRAEPRPSRSIPPTSLLIAALTVFVLGSFAALTHSSPQPTTTVRAEGAPMPTARATAPGSTLVLAAYLTAAARSPSDAASPSAGREIPATTTPATTPAAAAPTTTTPPTTPPPTTQPTTTAPPTTQAPTTAPPTTPPPTTTAPPTTPPPAPEPATSGTLDERTAHLDPGTGDLVGRARRALEAAVPAAWRIAAPARVTIINGSTSWSMTDGTIKIGRDQVDDTWRHALYVLAHEWGHQAAFRFGTGRSMGAPPAGFPRHSLRGAEEWSECVAQALTGYRWDSWYPRCRADSLAWTSQWLRSGPPG